MKKIKVIQICSASHSLSVNDYERDMFLSWYARIAFQFNKFYPNLEMECWTPEKEYKKQTIKEKEGIKFRIFPTSFSLRHSMEISFSMLKSLKKEIKEAKESNKKLIFHIHEYHSWLVYFILLSLKKGDFKVVAQHHGGRSPFKNLAKFKRFFLLFPVFALMQFFENLSLKKINTFYALSNDEVEYLKKKVGEKSSIKFQTMGIGEEYFEKLDKQKARKKLNLEKEKKYLLNIRGISRNKGIVELLNAIKKLKDEKIELILIGDNPELEIHKNYAHKNKIKNVRFLGAIYDERKLFYLSASDCFVLPSYNEGAPVVIMEAIAKNLPVVVTDVGGIPLMVKNGKEGRLIKPKSSEEIIKGIKEVLMWKERDIRDSAKRYKWEKIIKQTYEDYIKC